MVYWCCREKDWRRWRRYRQSIGLCIYSGHVHSGKVFGAEVYWQVERFGHGVCRKDSEIWKVFTIYGLEDRGSKSTRSYKLFLVHAAKRTFEARLMLPFSRTTGIQSHRPLLRVPRIIYDTPLVRVTPSSVFSTFF